MIPRYLCETLREMLVFSSPELSRKERRRDTTNSLCMKPSLKRGWTLAVMIMKPLTHKLVDTQGNWRPWCCWHQQCQNMSSLPWLCVEFMPAKHLAWSIDELSCFLRDAAFASGALYMKYEQMSMQRMAKLRILSCPLSDRSGLIRVTKYSADSDSNGM